jgi:hypothetical protein
LTESKRITDILSAGSRFYAMQIVAFFFLVRALSAFYFVVKTESFSQIPGINHSLYFLTVVILFFPFFSIPSKKKKKKKKKTVIDQSQNVNIISIADQQMLILHRI